MRQKTAQSTPSLTRPLGEDYPHSRRSNYDADIPLSHHAASPSTSRYSTAFWATANRSAGGAGIEAMKDVEKGMQTERKKNEEKKQTESLIPHTVDYDKKHGAYWSGTCYEPIEISDFRYISKR